MANVFHTQISAGFDPYNDEPVSDPSNQVGMKFRSAPQRHWRELARHAMQRNSAHLTDYFGPAIFVHTFSRAGEV